MEAAPRRKWRIQRQFSPGVVPVAVYDHHFPKGWKDVAKDIDYSCSSNPVLFVVERVQG
jgi:hypothetical protein